MNKGIFILGNGFDLSLGRKTSYISFGKSEYWPFSKDRGIKVGRSAQRLSDFLNEKLNNVNSWFDLESLLGEYSVPINEYDSPMVEELNVENEYKGLLSALSDYLKNQESTIAVNQDSLAAIVMRAVLQNGKFKIFNFNYTDIDLIAKLIHASESAETCYVHGSLKDNSIILGIESKNGIPPYINFFCKEYSPFYESNSLIRDLEMADEIIFFGHSLSAIDYHYFERFFSNLSSYDYLPESKKIKNISIFTADEKSRRLILDQLMVMNHNRLDLLFANTNLQFFTTIENTVTPKLQKLLDRLDAQSKRADGRKLKAFTGI